MLGNVNAFSSFSVDDLEKTKEFYEDTLGLKIEMVVMENYAVMELHIPGVSKIFIYPKKDHVPATFTVLNFTVTNLEKAVDDLKKQGVKFENYDGENIKTNEKGIFTGGGQSMAWFKDPSGNILSIIQEKI